MVNRLVPLLCLVTLGVLASDPGQADALCGRLQREYARSTEQSGGGDTQRMARQLQQLQSAAGGRLNCRPFPILGGVPSPQCPSVLAEIRRLQWQLHDARLGVPQFTSPDMLRRELVANGCAIPAAKPQQASRSAGSGRAICVRLCDGYYFPIEYSASRRRMKVDEQVCQSMYSGKDQAELFSYDPDKDVSTATSLLDGKRYGDQPYAFQYRQSYQPKCAAELTKGIAALGHRYRDALAAKRPGADFAANVPVPIPRPPPSSDPETVTDRAWPSGHSENLGTAAGADRRPRRRAGLLCEPLFGAEGRGSADAVALHPTSHWRRPGK